MLLKKLDCNVLVIGSGAGILPPLRRQSRRSVILACRKLFPVQLYPGTWGLDRLARQTKAMRQSWYPSKLSDVKWHPLRW